MIKDIIFGISNQNNMTHTITVLRNKTAKAIIARCYDADKSAAINADGLSMHGSSIDAVATKIDDGYSVSITSAVYELSTLQSFVNDVYAAIATNKAKKAKCDEIKTWLKEDKDMQDYMNSI